MLTINLYKLAKRQNSTKQPVGTETSVSLSGLMKTPSSIINPVITVKDNPNGYNYAYISDFSRYYFIDDIIYRMGEWEISLSVDALASFKTAIGTTYAYVMRSASHYTGTIKDDLYALTGAYSKNYQVWNPFGVSTNNMYFYVTCIGSSGATACYQIDHANFKTLVNELLAFGNDSSWLAGVQQAIKNSNYNPINYITNCFMFGYAMSSNTPQNTIEIGNTTINVSCIKIVEPFHSYSKTFTISDHPQAASRGKYCNMQPYTEHILCAGPFGNIAVPSDLLTESTNTVQCNIVFDIFSNQSTLIARANSTIFANITASMGTGVAIASNSKNIVGGALSIVSGAVGVGVSIASKDLARGLYSATGIASGITELTKFNTSTTGGNGSGVAWASYYTGLFSVYHTIADADNTNNGRPYCKYVQLNTLSGFMQCEKGTFASSEATATEVTEINNYMVNGFYYE